MRYGLQRGEKIFIAVAKLAFCALRNGRASGRNCVSMNGKKFDKPQIFGAHSKSCLAAK